MDKNISFTLKVWRQKGPKDKGHFDTFQMKDIPGDTSFLEMMDILNEQLINEGKEPIVFDHDCREGICGMCSMYINGHPHGPATGATTCQIYMRRFKDGDTITVEPWRSAGFPVIRDLMVDRSAYDKIMQAGGYVSINTGGIPDANAIPIAKPIADEAMDAAACIGCGACVAACKNGSAMLFVSAKVSQLALLPQGKVEAARRAKAMLSKMDVIGFVTEHDAVKHLVVGDFVCARFNHCNQGIGGCNRNRHLRFFTLFRRGVDNVFAVHQTDGNTADGAVPRNFRHADGDGNANHRRDFGGAVGVNGHHGCHHADVVAHILREQRTNRTVNHARGERCLFGSSALTAQERTGDSAHGIQLFFKIHGKRKEIHALAGLCGHGCGAKHLGFAVANQARTARELCHFADFDL